MFGFENEKFLYYCMMYLVSAEIYEIYVEAYAFE